MRLLLDTHVLFWWLTNHPQLSTSHRDLLGSTDNDVLVSAVSGWEIAIKVKIGKWPEASVLLPDLAGKVLAEGFELQPLTFAQAERAGGLDLAHRDPFDRMLAAQALDLGVKLVTSDPVFASLGCTLA